VDAIVMLNAHPSRATLSTEWLDPAIVDEHRAFARDRSLDMYNPENGPPFPSAFVARYREAQIARNRKITEWAREQLVGLGTQGHGPAGLGDLAFVVQGTAADLRFLDPSIDPSDREVGRTLWGPPQVANYMPAGISRVTTLRSWINQWSIDDTNADSLRWLPEIDVPVSVVLGTADVTVLPAMAQQMHDAATRAPVRDLRFVSGATHYFEGQPDLLDQALDHVAQFIAAHVRTP
jgi:pimeloyl-ACP methyl ester carboxylesterase